MKWTKYLLTSSMWLTATSAVTTTTPSLATDLSCHDDLNKFWLYNPKPQSQTQLYHSCKWVARDTATRCALTIAIGEASDTADESKDFNDEKPLTASDLCPVTCGTCPRMVVQNSIRTDSLCYQAGPEHELTTVVVDFENVEPTLEDWVGIYKDQADAENLGTPLAWAWLGSGLEQEEQPQLAKSLYGRITLQADLRLDRPYKAILGRRGNHEGPYRSFIESSTFELTNTGCAGRRKTRELSSHHKQHLHEDVHCSADLTLVGMDEKDDSFNVGQDITIDLHKQRGCSNIEDPNAFVGIYDSNLMQDEIWGDANYQTFLWTCGSQGCHDDSVVDQLVFGSDTVLAYNNWPLPEGRYRAHLVVPTHNNGSGIHHHAFQSVAISQEFTIERKTSQAES